jgi:hypothetical protein
MSGDEMAFVMWLGSWKIAFQVSVGFTLCWISTQPLLILYRTISQIDHPQKYSPASCFKCVLQCVGGSFYFRVLAAVSRLSITIRSEVTPNESASWTTSHESENKASTNYCTSQSTFNIDNDYSHPLRKSYVILLVERFILVHIHVACATCARTMTCDLRDSSYPSW